MLTPVITFLEALKEHNNHEWFQSHKIQYEDAKSCFLSFVDALLPELAKTDKSLRFVEARDCIFRIYRDVRFARDKSPYKINMGAWMTASGRRSSGPGYYLHVQPDESFLSGGVYMPDPEQLKKIRKEIFYNTTEFKAILKNRGFSKYFDGLSDMDKQKLAPRDFPNDFPDIDLLKHKHYILHHPLNRELLSTPELPEYILTVFRKMLPFNEFLKKALQVE